MAKPLYFMDIETDGSFPWNDKLVCLGVNGVVLDADEGRQKMKEILTSPSIIIAHSNYDLRWMLMDGLWQGWLDMKDIHPELEYHDTKVMAFMLDSTQELNLDFLCQKYLGTEPLWKPIREVKGTVYFESKVLNKLVRPSEVPWDEMVEYNLQDIVETEKFYYKCKELMQDKQGQNLWEMFLTEEMPFSKLLVEMEVAGMPLNRGKTEEMLAQAREEHERLGAELQNEVGSVFFNLRRKDYVSAYLYDELPVFEGRWEIPLKYDHKILKETWESAVGELLPHGITIEKITQKYVYGSQVVKGKGFKVPYVWYPKGKTPAWPTVKAEILTVNHGQDAWVQKYLRWQALNTLITAYLETWLEAEHDGRIHGRFDQARAQTGRLASRDPNLQSIPVTMDWDVRALFEAPLVLGDYSGLDARMAAHMSQDPIMMDIYLNGKDLYGVLAANTWGGPPTKKNENRALMKILFLSQNYGAGAPSIADDISISGLGHCTVQEARQFLKDLEESLPVLFAWRRRVEHQAMQDGFVTTITGRRRYLPDLYVQEQGKRARAVRQCVASAVQGSGADLVRRCMLAARKKIDPDVAKIIVQVHDEIVWERGPNWSSDVLTEIQSICENDHGMDLSLPFSFPCEEMESWAEKDSVGARGFRINTSGGVVAA